MKKQHIQLSQAERDYLKKLVAKGELSAKVYKRAIGLMELDRGKTLTAVAQTLKVSNSAVANWRDKYKQSGLQCLHDHPRSGRPIEIDGGNGPKSPRWLVVSHRPVMSVGRCACWPIKRWN